MQRRRLLFALAAAPLLRARLAVAQPGSRTILVAAWDDASGKHRIGRLAADTIRGVRVLDQIEVPTRAHGLTCRPDGSVIAVARRPGDWLLRWKPGAAAEWHWADEARRFSGHLLQAPDGSALWTTELDLDSGEGVLVRRDLATLAALDAWPIHGRDPHDMEWLDDVSVLVANGGIETLSETGRAKHNLAQMDASLVRIDARTGSLTGQWRLQDRRLSIRHLARHADSVGIALQAEHDDASSRATAPVLATFDLRREVLRAHPSVCTPAGYAGDIAAVRGGWLVSCPKDDQLLHVPGDGGAPAAHPLAHACAIAIEEGGDDSWVLGSGKCLKLTGRGREQAPAPALRFYNHATPWHG